MVDIKIRLDAKGVEGQILAIKGALESLNDVGDDIDIGDEIDDGSISGSVGNIMDSLNELDGKLGDVGSKLDEIDGAEIEETLQIETPDGSTGSGDSTGGDPQQVLKFTSGELADFVDEGESSVVPDEVTDGGERANILDRTLGEHTVLPKSDIYDGLLGDYPNRDDRGRQLPHKDSRFLERLQIESGAKMGPKPPRQHEDSFEVPHILQQIGSDGEFGFDSRSMKLRRLASEFSEEALLRAGDVEDKSVDTDSFEFKKSILSDFFENEDSFMSAERRSAQRLLDEGIDVDKAKVFKGAGFDEISQARQDEIFDEAGISETKRLDDEGNRKNLPQFSKEDQDKIREAFAEAFDDIDLTKGRSRTTFRDINDFNIPETPDDSDIDFNIPETAAEVEAATGPGVGDVFGHKTLGDDDADADADADADIDVDSDGGSPFNFRKREDRISDFFENISDVSSKFGNALSKAKPTMGKYMQLLAALIPMAVALGTQLLGVAAAMGAVATAGAGIIGLGLLGHGESLAGSMEQAKLQMRDLKKEMFEQAQPLMSQFAPIQSRIFDAIPEGMGGITEEMEGLMQFEDTLFAIGDALSGGIEEFFAIINRNKDAIDSLVLDIGGLIGSGLLNFFEWLIQTAHENKQLLKELGGAFISLAVIGFNLSMVIGRIVAALRPLIDFVAWLSGLLNSKLSQGLLNAIATMLVMGFVFTKVATTVWALGMAVNSLASTLAFLGGGSIIAGIIKSFKSLITYIAVAIQTMFGLETAAYKAAAAIAATGIGALLVAGGMAFGEAMKPDIPDGGAGAVGAGGGFGNGQKRVVNDNRTYNFEGTGSGEDYSDMKALHDEVRRVNREDSATNRPDVNTTAPINSNN